MKFLSLDIGTTCCKCQLFSENGDILEYISREYDFRREEGYNYVDIKAVWSHVKEMIAEVASHHEISSLCVSSLGEAFTLLDKEDNILFYPMLYTDPRGEEEAAQISARLGEEACFKISGTVPHSMYSISKLLWIKNNYPQLFAKADKVLLVGEYIGYLLTGKRVIDQGLAARTGVLDVKKKEFSDTMLSALDVKKSLFSTVMQAGSIVGAIKPSLARELGMDYEPLLVLGSHDQVCASLGAGVLSEGDAADGMGTVECLTVLHSAPPENIKMGQQGYPCVPYAIDGLYCTYILNYSCCSSVNWYRKKIMHEYCGGEKNFFSYIEKDIGSEPSGILTLPYLGGAATPYQDLSAKGAVIGLTTETSDSALFQSLLEGTAMEMRFNSEVAENYEIHIREAVATGGGANSKKWLQIKADIQNIPIKALRSGEGGLCGCAMLQAVALGSSSDLFEARERFVRYTHEFLPNEENHKAYEESYLRYKKIYNTLKELY